MHCGVRPSVSLSTATLWDLATDTLTQYLNFLRYSRYLGRRKLTEMAQGGGGGGGG